MSRSTFFISVEIFKIETFQSRLWRVEIFVEICRDAVEICQDLSRNLNIVEAFWVWKWWKVLTDWEISTRKYKNPCTSRSRSRQTVKKRQNFQISTNFSISIETFWSRRFGLDVDVQTKLRSLDLDRDISTVETHFLTLSRFSRLSRLTLWRRRDKSRPPCLVVSSNTGAVYWVLHGKYTEPNGAQQNTYLNLIISRLNYAPKQNFIKRSSFDRRSSKRDLRVDY